MDDDGSTINSTSRNVRGPRSPSLSLSPPSTAPPPPPLSILSPFLPFILTRTKLIIRRSDRLCRRSSKRRGQRETGQMTNYPRMHTRGTMFSNACLCGNTTNVPCITQRIINMEISFVAAYKHTNTQGTGFRDDASALISATN